MLRDHGCALENRFDFWRRVRWDSNTFHILASLNWYLAAGSALSDASKVRWEVLP